MAHIILVHGAAANELSWFAIPEPLERQGHHVDAIRLPGHSRRLRARAAPVSMQDYVDAVIAAMPPSGLCILIGHSLGGFTISQVAVQVPDRVSRLIYVAAMLPVRSETPLSIVGRAGTSLADVAVEFLSHGVATLPALSRQPKGPLSSRFEPTTAFSDIPRVFVRCTDDGILPDTLQSEMIGSWPGTQEVVLHSDHLPQLDVPEQLEEALIEASA